jgi:hypothetical protein
MKYSEHREKIKSGDIIILSHSKWGSFYDLQVQAVRLFQESEYSHVGLAWKCSGRLFVIEAVTPYVRIFPLSNYAQEGFYHIPLKKPMESKELEFALSKVGNGKYSKWEAILAFFRALSIGKDNLWQCAEFVMTCRKLSGVNLGGVATPAAIVKTALENGYQLKYIQGD